MDILNLLLQCFGVYDTLIIFEYIVIFNVIFTILILYNWRKKR